MTVRTISVAVATTLLAVLVGSPAPALAAPPLNPNNLAIQGTCVPLKGPGHIPISYCTNSELSNIDLRGALDWADDHTSKHDRSPVPFPGQGSKDSNNNKYTYVVYVVRYRHILEKGYPHLWKYGITRQDPYTKRSSDGVRECNHTSPIEEHTRICADNWVSGHANDSYGGHGYKPYYQARYFEASLIKQWSRKHGDKCPPGAKSCK